MRLVIFAAMAGLLVASICVPGAFDDSALIFAVAYAVVRAAHIALFWIASDDDPDLRKSTTGLGISTAIACGVLVGASFADGAVQGALWVLAIAIDFGGPYFFGAAGWKLMPEHFAERHGLIIIIALGESIVAIGAGVTGEITGGGRRHRRRRHRPRGGDVVGVLRRRRTGRDAPPGEHHRPPGAKRDWRATRTRFSTCPWSPGSSWSRSG